MITDSEIEAAASRIEKHAVRTPVLEFPEINDMCDRRVLLKVESLQRTGSFKFRGAFNALSQLPSASHVVAFSSGNHAQAVACAASMLGHRATIVMPEDAPAMKLRKTRSWGAEVVLYDRYTESRELLAEDIVHRQGGELIKPYDDVRVVTGQATAGRELRDDVANLDAVLVPCGGGGLVAGIASSFKDSGARVYAVEPESHNDTQRSLSAGERCKNREDATSMCDALLAPTPGVFTFPINLALLAGGYAVSEAAVSQAMRVAFDVAKLVVEPGGAVALAAVLSGVVDAETVAVVLSGGNVDRQDFFSLAGDRL